jgi:GTPase involved in cell partitioning and DNA repair
LIDTSDTSELDPVKSFEIIEGELAAFSEKLMEKPMIVVATKVDATTERTKLEELEAYCKKKGIEFHAISAPTGEGVKELVRSIADALDRIPKVKLEEDDAESVEEPEVAEFVEDEEVEADDEDEPEEGSETKD